MKQEHERVLTPLWSYMYLDIRVWVILAMCASLLYAHRYGLRLNREWDDKLEVAVTFSLYFAIVAHTLEAMYVAYKCQSQAKLTVSATLKWFTMICLTGYPITTRFFQLLGGAKIKKES